ncbi:lysophosphatidic acid acyltransferase / lysophosphatidylinositol acyltransferase [Marchantia polymorpha subsp. ruderalis]|uniref:1-acylglycerol-3-phosphate O-acyltransferase n=2 Tax=Marchantia polymorpha TaxID=3197 RepID=A0A176WHA5_MARPO|nr:hypothetical protein AXG93_3242s1290 [Marchantia polymorpha subsp. ruderalis]PTQ44059.1 hypothetical protein MARPO_0022s0149 [Marchantia polymorpha]PTQ44060.1 hypothetical protein MARPO_0022s0149 [Marchantia polymorpha]BBN04344.1 hypothetical protein Mp_3g03820 [Marchantia polymorpha subsp. ruderalis]BBN04345.1 hypothetical protein Mp_3g03820 [Marchantia polymorpha subsp. ruderalis]|eukprot:PTQ44059.1 hypothetical protein MARPO_0022s0149 [Marchantia polymorpha]
MALSFIALPLGLMFLISGFLINGLQVLSLVLLLFSRKAYRVVNMIMMDILWSELVWLLDWWAGVKVRLYADGEAMKYLGKEHALLICNHRSDIDWLVGWLLAQRFGCLGGTRAVMKQSVKYLPVIGWSMYFSEYVFLARSWAKDEVTLKAGYRSLKGFPRPFWLALFVEGTRFTKKKLEAAQEYAASANMHIPQNVLIPRTKGFVSAIANLREFVPAVYDMTLAVSNDSTNPTMSGILKGQSSTIHVHLRRVPIETLPKADEEIAAWCKEAFVKKDEMLDDHNKINSFGEDLYQPIARTKAPLLIVIGWGIFLLTSSIWLLRDVLSTWRGCMYVAGALSLISVLLEVLIGASQAERSSSKSSSRPSSKSSAVVKTEEKKKK